MIKKILYLNINGNLGGAERVLFEEASFLVKEGLTVEVILPYRGPLSDKLTRSGVGCVIMPIPKAILKLSKESFTPANTLGIIEALFCLFAFTMRLGVFISRNKPDLIVSNSFKFHFITALLKSMVGIPIVWRCHDALASQAILRKMFLFISARSPDKIIANSHFVLDELSCAGVSKNKMEMVYCGFNATDFNCPEEERRQYRKELRLSDSDFAVGTLGALVPWKGQGYLLQAGAIIKDKIPGLKIFVAGAKIYDTDTPDTRGYLEGLAKELGLGEIVQFNGFLEDNKKFLNALDVFVHTPTSPEPFGRVVVEAMLCLKPVVAAASGGIIEIIRDRQNGLLVAPRDANSVAEAIFELYKNSDFRTRLAVEGRRFAEVNFNMSSQMNKIMYIYNNLKCE